MPLNFQWFASAEQVAGGSPADSAPAFSWETLRPGRQWLGGIAPVYDHQFRCHVCRLAAGDSTLFEVPPRAMVRLWNPCGPLRNDDVAIWTSNGSGLFCRQVGRPDTTGQCLIVATDDAHVSLVRVDRLGDDCTTIRQEVSRDRKTLQHGQALEPTQRDCSKLLAIAVSLSGNHVHKRLSGRPCTIEGCGRTVRLSHSSHGPGTIHTLLPAGRLAVIVVDRCARLRIETRLQYPDDAGQNRQTYKLAVAANGVTLRRIEFETTSEFRRRVYVDRCARVVGQQRCATFDIQRGCAQVTITSTADLYVRVLEIGDDAYHWPALNGPSFRTDPLRQIADPFAPVSLWSLAVQGARGPTIFSHRRNRLFRDVVMLAARDNRYRDGGLRAAMRMRIAADAYPEDPRVR
ncbi:MAG: hypothetical protein ACC645_06630, partial [Pirellulales bacterium]